MQPFQQLAALALDPLVEGAAQALAQVGGERTAEAVAALLRRQFLDQSRRLPAALQRANASAWKAVEVALAGESLWTRLDRAEHKAFREQLRAFLAAALPDEVPGDRAAFCGEALAQLRAARRAGLLEGTLDPDELARAAGALARFGDAQALLEAEGQAVAALAEQLRQADYAALARLLELRTDPQGTTLLVAAVRFFFRREVEADPELFRGLAWARLESLQGRHDRHFSHLAEALASHGALVEELLDSLQETAARTHGAVLEIREEVLGLARRFDLLHRELRPHDSLSLRGDEERQLVKEVVARYRALPEEERRRLPGVLNAVGKLEAAAGYLEEARKDFQEAAALGGDDRERAEANHNAYEAALEQGDWPAALGSLREALALDPGRFAPFPPAKYEPEAVLGAGGFGVAFLCRNRHSGSRVVVKALRPGALARAVADVFREAHALEELEHPAIIRLRDCDFADAGQTRPYLVMDRFDGPTLAGHVARHGPLPADDLAAVMRPVAEALRAAHGKGILHRDVKPANLLVRRDEAGRWRVKLIDFGLALRQEALSGPERPTVTGRSIAGTLEYAAPEQLGRLPGVGAGPASDVYGFGKTCCFALFGTTQPLRKHWREVPDALADLLEQCLCESPAERLADFGAVLERLDRLGAPPPPEPPEPAVVVPAEKRPREWWRAAPGEAGTSGPVRQLRGHAGAVLCVSFSPDGRRLLAGCADGTVHLWDVATGEEICRLRGHTAEPGAVVFTPDGRFGLSAAKDNTVRLWDLERGEEAHVWPGRTNGTLALAGDGRLVLTGSTTEGMVRLWELASGRELGRFKGHMSWVRGLAFAPGGRLALSASDDGTVRLWEVDTGREVRRLEGHTGEVYAVALAGPYAVSGGADGTVRLWNLRSGREDRCVPRHAGPIAALAATADGRFLLFGGGEPAVRLWELEWLPRPHKLASARERPALRGHTAEVTSVALSADGRLAASGDRAGSVLIWALPT